MIEEQNINQLPKDWKWVKLGEVCDKMTNGANAKQSEDKIGFPISRIETIWNETIDLGRVKYIEENDEAFVAKYSLQKNDILFSHINSDIHLGKTAIFKNQTKVLIHGINLLLIRLNIDVLADFFNYQFKYKRRRGEFISIAQKSVNQSSINQPKLKNVDFVLPPKPTQQAIVSKIEELFSELDKGIEQLKTAQQQLKTYRQSVLKWAFEGKLTNSLNHNLYYEHDLTVAAETSADYKTKNNQGNQSNHINHSSDKGELPEGWKWVTINDIGKIKGGKRLPPKHQYSEEQTSFVYIMAGNLKDGTVKNKPTYIKEETYKALANYKVIGGEVYITIVGACIGDAGVIPENIGKSILTENAAKIIELKDTCNKYLSLWINSTKCQENIKSKILSATLGKLALNRIGTLEVPLPPIAEQNNIVQEIESRLSVTDKMEESINQSLQQAEALRQSILKKAFEGKINL